MKLLDDLKKKLGKSPDTTEEEVNMSVEDKAPVELANTEATVAELATLKASFEEQAEQLAQLKAELEAAQASLAVVAEEKATAEAAAKQAKMDVRLTKLKDVVGDVKAAELSVAFEQLDDKVFEAMVGTLSANMATEAASAQFSEAGVDAKPAPVVEKDAVTRLADNIAAQFNLKK